MDIFIYIVAFSAIAFLLSEVFSGLGTHLTEKSKPFTNKSVLSVLSGLHFLFFFLSLSFSIPYHAIHQVHSHYLWKRVSRKIKTAYKVGITDAYYLHRTDSERKFNARRYYIPENEDYYEYNPGFRDQHIELHYWSWKRDILANAELSEDDLQ